MSNDEDPSCKGRGTKPAGRPAWPPARQLGTVGGVNVSTIPERPGGSGGRSRRKVAHTLGSDSGVTPESYCSNQTISTTPQGSCATRVSALNFSVDEP